MSRIQDFEERLKAENLSFYKDEDRPRIIEIIKEFGVSNMLNSYSWRIKSASENLKKYRGPLSWIVKRTHDEAVMIKLILQDIDKPTPKKLIKKPKADEAKIRSMLEQFNQDELEVAESIIKELRKPSFDTVKRRMQENAPELRRKQKQIENSAIPDLGSPILNIKFKG